MGARKQKMGRGKVRVEEEEEEEGGQFKANHRRQELDKARQAGVEAG